MKKYVCLFLIFFIVSCVSHNQEAVFDCPNVSIVDDASFFTRGDNINQNFQIELIGFKHYCYSLDNVTRRYSVITPKYRVTRLRPHDENAIDFSFYTNTEQGPPEYLGKQSYYVNVKIPEGSDSFEFESSAVKVKIPPYSSDFKVTIGLDMSPSERSYKDRHFDTRHFKKETPKEQTCDQKTTSSCGCGM